MVILNPIGTIRSPYTDKAQIPKGPGAQHEAEGVLEIRPELEPGLTDIEGFSHLYVVWIFDRAEGYDLLSLPPTDDRPHGVFATRTPRRPNPLGLTVVHLLRRDGPRLRVRGLDMLDGTPIVDIKPYLTSVPVEQVRRGWLAEAEARGRSQGLGRSLTGLFVLGPALGAIIGWAGITTLATVRSRIGVRRGPRHRRADVELCDCFLEYGEATAEMLLQLTFVALGTSIIWTGLSVADAPTLGFAFVALTASVVSHTTLA